MTGNINSLLFIPDISGFTEFVNETDLNHSYHIVAVLLELLIDANTLDMTVSEVEGDAILFYRYGSVPTVEEILQQARLMFVRFHEHLMKYEQHRICSCGACRTAHRLKLKMIAHAGNIRHLTIKQHHKIYGPDVILLHRLLKNDVPSDEYLLLTEALVQQQEEVAAPDWVKWEQNVATYPKLGAVPHRYTLLDPLYAGLQKPAPPEPAFRSATPMMADIYIHSPPQELYELLSNLEYRLSWQQGLKDLQYNKTRLNRLGTEHVCVLEVGKLSFETVTVQVEADEQVYGEKLRRSFIFKNQVNYFFLRQEGAGTRLRMEIHYEKIKWPFGWLEGVLRKKMSEVQQKVLADLKTVAESMLPVPA
ncbi:MAG: DUF2652 domain-containing protein [Bacteroidetes bacterium]|nr:MAG: DUF2652 domain-containing protein [Bacteroidota bacterium]